MAKGLKITIHTNELSPEQMTAILSLYEKQGWFVFKETSIKNEEIKDLPDIKIETGEKPPSQRMRAVLFRIWENDKRGKTFEQYYREQMERIIEQLKSKLS